MQLLELLLVFLVRQCRGEIHGGQLRHLEKGEVLLEGLAHIAAFLQSLVHLPGQQAQGVPGGQVLLLAVQHMPGDQLAGLFHEGLVALPEELVLPLLPQILLGHPPLGLKILPQGAHALALLVAVDIHKELQQQIAAVPQLAFKLVHRADALLVLLPGDLPVHVLAHAVLHPAGVVEHNLSVFRDGLGIGVEEGIARFALRRDDWGDHVIKARIQLADQLVDQTALARSGPALHQHDDGQTLGADRLLQTHQMLAHCLDLRLQLGGFLFFTLFFLFAHG